MISPQLKNRGYSGKFKDLDGHVWEILWDPKFKEYVRHDFGAVRPYFYGHLDLPEFVKHTFGAVELERIGDDKGFHVESKIGDSVVVMETGNFRQTLRRRARRFTSTSRMWTRPTNAPLNAARRRWPNRKTSLTMSGAQECKIRSEIRGGYLHSKNAFKQLTKQSSEEVVHLAMSDAMKR